MLNEFAKEVHKNAVKHGWWEDNRSFGEIIALCHSELSEALEEYRSENPAFWFEKKDEISSMFGEESYDKCKHFSEWRGEKPEGVAVEMADCIIRILDWCGKENIDIDSILKAKHEFNKTRPYKHGGKIL